MALKIFESKKHVFWQAFFVTALFFLLGLVLGVYLEQIRSDNFSLTFSQSEVSLYDSFALGQVLKDSTASCDTLKEVSTSFADKIYTEAVELEKFDESNELTDSIKTIHKKYDLLRTLLWMNVLDLKENCKINTVVYLYVYDTQDIGLKSKQIVWSRLLQELKEKKGDEFILIPIAVDQDIISLDYLIKKYDIKEFPAVIINEKNILYEHETTQKLSSYLI